MHRTIRVVILTRLTLLALWCFCLLMPSPARASVLSFEMDGGGTAWIGAVGFYLNPVPSNHAIFRNMVFSTGAGLAVPNAVGGFDYAFDDGVMTFYSEDGFSPVAVIPVLPFSPSLSAALTVARHGEFGAMTSRSLASLVVRSRKLVGSRSFSDQA